MKYSGSVRGGDVLDCLSAACREDSYYSRFVEGRVLRLIEIKLERIP
jgi:hypothetical protein